MIGYYSPEKLTNDKLGSNGAMNEDVSLKNKVIFQLVMLVFMGVAPNINRSRQGQILSSSKGFIDPFMDFAFPQITATKIHRQKTSETPTQHSICAVYHSSGMFGGYPSLGYMGISSISHFGALLVLLFWRTHHILLR